MFIQLFKNLLFAEGAEGKLEGAASASKWKINKIS